MGKSGSVRWIQKGVNKFVEARLQCAGEDQRFARKVLEDLAGGKTMEGSLQTSPV
jgi:hypothetical protein